MYILKQIPQDFIVNENSNVELKESGRFAYVKLTKIGRNTQDVINEIANALHLKENKIGFAGSKDKQAVTQQLISIQGRKKETIESLDILNCQLEVVGYGNEPITLGNLEGNYFEITIRNLEDETLEKVDTVLNYFDEQRFSKNNAQVGKFLILKKFKDAAQLVHHFKVKQHLEENKNDAIGALKRLPIRTLKMYVNAYQSYLFNETISRLVTNPIKEVTYSQGKLRFSEDLTFESIPLIGFNSGLVEKHNARDVMVALMKQEGIWYKDFVIKQIPPLSAQGEMRKTYVEVKDLTIGERENDELNETKKKVTISFYLGKGSYATMVVKRIIQEK